MCDDIGGCDSSGSTNCGFSSSTNCDFSSNTNCDFSSNANCDFSSTFHSVDTNCASYPDSTAFNHEHNTGIKGISYTAIGDGSVYPMTYHNPNLNANWPSSNCQQGGSFNTSQISKFGWAMLTFVIVFFIITVFLMIYFFIKF